MYEITGPYLLRASEKYEPYSTSAIARVEYGSYFSLARNKYEGITNECDSTNWLCQLSNHGKGQVAKIMRELKNLRYKAVIGQTVLVLRLYSYMQRLAMARGGI